jgi:hypothetical protein
MPGRSLEQQVLEQVGHAGLAVVLVARSDHVGHVDRHRRLGVVGVQQHLQAVGEAVFVDPFDGPHELHAGRQLGRWRGMRDAAHHEQAQHQASQDKRDHVATP